MKKMKILSSILLAGLLGLISCGREDTGLKPVSMGGAYQISETSATLGGTVTISGVTEHGFVWSKSMLPTMAHSILPVQLGVHPPGTIIDNFEGTLPQLDPGTKYYARTYAVTNGSTIYSNVISFTTKSINK